MTKTRARPYQKNFIMRLSAEDEARFDRLAEIYQLGKSNLVREALARMEESLPPGIKTEAVK